VGKPHTGGRLTDTGAPVCRQTLSDQRFLRSFFT
jgi:hypothetical protein